MIQVRDVHEYGDFALTKYYDPCDDIGLGESDWLTIQEIVKNDSARESPILGTPVGSGNKIFDPGKMGSYFQSVPQVASNYQYLRSLDQQSILAVMSAIEMLKRAKAMKSGLYITF